MSSRFLPLLSRGPHGSRSPMTCHFRCGDACFRPVPNQSDHPHIADVVGGALARRSVLRTGAAGTGALLLSGLLDPATAATAGPGGHGPGRGPGHDTEGISTANFTSVAPNRRDAVTVAEGFRHEVVVRWGDPVTRDAPAFDAYRQTPESAAQQFGYNNDYVGLVPLSRHGAVLVANNEYTDEVLMFPDGVYDDDTIKRIAMASHGMSIVQIERGRRPGSWRLADHRSARLNRRLTASSPFLIDGPAAGDERLTTSRDRSGRRVHGTFGNCAGGTTPWGTVLSGEENFNGYFDRSGDLDARYAASYQRYGLTGAGRGWKDVDSRFDLSQEPHEPFRFGWIVEVDPLDPRSTPRKHSMLGRFKHEGANVTVARNGQVAVYMGDDERGDYIYKFVSAKRFDARDNQSARKHNLTLLTEGTLYVARFTDEAPDPAPEYDGVGTWIPLTSHLTSYVEGMSVSDVLIDTRLAADKVGPTRMDRPEDIEPNPVNGKIYCALTNNSNRGSSYPTDEANPLATSRTRTQLGAPLTTQSGNRNGYILEITEDGGDHTGTGFTWDLMLVCGDPSAPETYFAGFPKDRVSAISCPDNLAFDRAGNLWISTDGNALGSNDGLFRVPVAGAERGHVEQFLTVPLGAETCGPLVHEDRSVFAAVQHPGETTGSTFEQPSSTWPHTDAFPRPSVIVSYRA